MRPLAALVASIAVSTPALAQPVTYQGSLGVEGAPANGDYDMTFRLYDDPIAGEQIGADAALLAVPVADGLFSVQLDFGPGAWAGTPATVYLETMVADAGSLAFETLTPRQPITPAPLAVESLNHPVFTLNDPTYGTLLHNTLLPARLMLNREFPVNEGDYLTLDAPVPTQTLGGLTVNTTDPLARPYYAYASGGVTSAFTWTEPAEQVWRLDIDGEQLAVDSSGNLTAQGYARADDFSYADPQERILTIHPIEFHAMFAGTWAVQEFYGNASDRDEVATQIRLPQGAIVTNVRIFFFDSVASDYGVVVRRQTIADPTLASISTLASFETSGVSFDMQIIQATQDRLFSPFVIDNTQYAYTITVLPTVGQWALQSSRLHACQVFYTVPKPD